jgi:hypothetical protein
MFYDLNKPERWADHVMIIPEKEYSICDKCINPKANLCPGKDKCPVIKK